MQPDEQRRRLILETAERLLRHYGPGKTTIAEIARACSIGVGTVYLEFPSKDAIIEELSRLRHMTVLNAMRGACADGSQTYSARLQKLFEAKVETFLRLADGGPHALDLVHCSAPAVQTSYARFQKEEIAVLAELLRDATRSGEFDVDDPERTALSLLRAYAGFSPPWIYRQPREELFANLRDMHGLIMQGLLRRNALRRGTRI